MILASQNLEDFDVDGIRELTRPLFAIPTHQFLFNAGSVNKKFYMDNLQLEPAEFELIRYGAAHRPCNVIYVNLLVLFFVGFAE